MAARLARTGARADQNAEIRQPTTGDGPTGNGAPAGPLASPAPFGKPSMDSHLPCCSYRSCRSASATLWGFGGVKITTVMREMNPI